ncbi:methyltransferase [Desulfobacter hydrogenophilus]|uniref:Methyltransferase n=1 Tax=Desulfobacter hydrogenophilus TaxID=2291 RepID=A0A328FDP5_9BACT|nr:class I SAM-dependent methyltransferase [Desulfobacter hydrogenophilus]NDY71244.1 class I SAM-dependent methyltransferase [Desulfobacter hydrogenophilus]QBH15016.1 class I SAM-dependent methyltransferase [Desulfobacter hydrogenophilus]RAM02738.1 methyltransferase [Desulfobacter hydrogenophilus]
MDHSTLDYYNQNALKVAERYESADVTQLHDFLSSSLKPGGRLLELGCGSGRDAAFMVSQGFKVLATDGSASMIEQAKQHHPELAEHMVHLKLPDGLLNALGVFHGIYAVAVLMHLSVQDIESTISTVNSLLTAKGRFIFSVPARRDDVMTNEFDSKGRQFTALSPEGWTDLCLKCNLHIVRTMISEDGLGRDGAWMNCLAEKP